MIFSQWSLDLGISLIICVPFPNSIDEIFMVRGFPCQVALVQLSGAAPTIDKERPPTIDLSQVEKGPSNRGSRLLQNFRNARNFHPLHVLNGGLTDGVSPHSFAFLIANQSLTTFILTLTRCRSPAT
jgi:hypothetical protein